MILRRRTSLLQRVIQGRQSFKRISACADALHPTSLHASSSETIALFFLQKHQEAVEARLREQKQLLHRLGFPQFIDLLRFSAYCSWRASLLCGSLFNDILHAHVSISRIHSILNSPSCHTQVDDLLLTLADLHNLLSEDKLERIRHVKDLLAELDHDLKSYQTKIGVRALSGISTVKHRTRDGMLSLKPVARHVQEILWSKLSMCSTGMSNYGSDKRDLMRHSEDVGNDDDDLLDKAGMHNSGLPSPLSPCCQKKIGFSCLHKIHMRLYQIETSMHAVSVTLDTLMPLVSCTHSQGMSQHFIESLRDEPLMFDGVAAHIADCNAGLSKHLEDVREQVLICFCFINNARDLAYAI